MRKNVKSFLKSIDYIQNRDRQNPTGVLEICNPEFLTFIVNLDSLILYFMVLCACLIIFVKKPLTILWTFALREILLISMDQTRKWLSLEKKPADQGKVFSKLLLV